MCLPSFGTSEPTVRTPDWSRPMGFYPSLQGLPCPYVCYVCLCVSHFSPRRGSRRPGFADVGPKVLILRRLKLHGIKPQKVPKVQGLKKRQKNHSLACKKKSRF